MARKRASKRKEGVIKMAKQKVGRFWSYVCGWILGNFFFLELRLWTKLGEQLTCSLFMQVEITEKYYCLEFFFFLKINLFQSEIY